jgi:UPF0755 protein
MSKQKRFDSVGRPARQQPAERRRNHRLPQVLLWTILLWTILGMVAAGCSNDVMLRSYLDSHSAELDQASSVDDSPIRFVVEPGTPARVIAQNLQEAGLIHDAMLFEAYVRLNGLAERLEAGTFILNARMTPVEIAAALQNARAASVAVTIPEGWRLEQTAAYLSEAEVLDGEAYRQQAGSGDLGELDPGRYPFLMDRPAGTSLEGYLFPDTYELPAEGATVADLLGRQLDNFALKVLPVYEEAARAGSTNMDLYTVLTLASVVEREAVIPGERPAIAAVYLNRLAQGIKLEADPTVQYAMGYQEATGQWWKTPVFLEEYSSVDSPYNTYLYPGLPPGPIASPGLSSIVAVLNPDEHNYLFFVATPEGDGLHVFAETFEEHVENVRKYLGQ